MPEVGVRLECILCHTPFTKEAILRFEFFFESGVCYSCYVKMQALPANISCFGKRYSPIVLECKRICPDRKVCPLFQSKEIRSMRKEALTAEQRRGALALLREQEEAPRFREHPFTKGSIIHEAFELCCTGCSKEELRRMVTKKHADLARILRIFRREQAYGKRWIWHEQASGYSIKYSKKD